jgi:hypothetical protein
MKMNKAHNHTDTLISSMQSKAMGEQLLDLLPSGGSILNVVVGASIEDDGPWPNQFNLATRYLDDGDRAVLFDDYCAPSPDSTVRQVFGLQKYDALCYRGYCLNDGSPLYLFNVAISVLNLGGFFLCLAAMDNRGTHNSPLPPYLSYFCAIASRCGFLRQNINLLQSEGAWDHWMIVFQKGSASPRWILTHMKDPGLTGFSKLFKDSFNSEANGQVWRWKYGAGRGRAIVAKKGDRLVAHYGSTLRAVSYFGKSGSALQICDVMVDPRERGVMTKTGAMFIATTTFNEIYLGLQNVTIAYGFPNLRHMALGKRLGLYTELARMAQVQWPPVPSGPRFLARLCFLEAKDVSKAHSTDLLWGRMAKDLRGGIGVIRNWDYLNYRYFAHPTNSYTVIGVSSRWTRRLLGIIVLRRENKSCELVDLIAPLRRIPLLVDQARWIAGRWGCEDLYCWTTEHDAHRFTCEVGIITQTDTVVAMMIWPGGRSIEQLKNKWWLMSGDMEFR